MKSDKEIEIENFIHRYFGLSERIGLLKTAIKYREYEFSNRSFYNWIEFGEMSIKNVGVKVEKEVINHVSSIELTEKRIQRLNKREYYFTNYLNNLSKTDYVILKSKYTTSYELLQFTNLDKQTYDEILEIEEAIAFQFDYFLEKESNYLELKAFKSDYEKMLEELGV